ncbi:membrane protein [Catalinimonas alkaloidigena]|uniref:Membrane protein n=1 Tax=Catalinimonas alkaloidigena TaxID=1075417 RepID=A0A1G9K8C4_9BACT|nr:YihY/virulence factor BrkB family protein [Catalinimonas alkaloidigena]SDL45685.1 membrane protein [Catalinimonas alkaloidigena]
MKLHIKNFKLSHLWSLLKETYKEWNDDEPFRQSAVVAYYAIFSLPALMIIIVKLAGYFYGEEAVQGKISGQISQAIGPQAAEGVQDMIANSATEGSTTIAIIIGVATLLFGATGVFYQLQQTLNYIWEVRIDPKSGIKKLVVDRATSLGLIIAIGFLLLISLVLTSALSAFSDWIEQYVPDFLMAVFFVAEFALSFGVVTLLFAIIFKVLPDVEIEWRTVWVGALMTAFLFVVGKFALGIYFGKADPASAYGAAGSVILILLWVSYSCLILFFGAEFTQVYARRYGHRITPSSHAIPMPDFYASRQDRRTNNAAQRSAPQNRQQERPEKTNGTAASSPQPVVTGQAPSSGVPLHKNPHSRLS